MSGSIPTAPSDIGIISPGAPFVAPDSTPTPLSFRFLFELWRRLGVIEAQLPGAGATTYTGTSTTDGSGVFTASWPAFSSVFRSLTISTTDPVYPGGIVAPTTITLSSYTGTLSTTDNLYPTPSSVVQPGVTFGWIVSGY
jgi:hypothetical protein